MQKSIFLLIIFAGISSMFITSCSSSKKKVFEQEAAEQNRLAPIMIDVYTRVDSVRYSASDNSFRYYYTLTGDADNKEVAVQKRKELQEQLPAEIKEAPGLTIHRNHKVVMEYIYFSEQTGEELFRVKITPEMYR